MVKLSEEQIKEHSLEIMNWCSYLLFDEVGSLETPFNYSKVLLEIMALLTRPEISQKLPEWSQESAGMALKRIIEWFDLIEGDGGLEWLRKGAA